jgi:hypothetical protein
LTPRPTAAIAIIHPPSTSGGSLKRWAASMKIQIEIATSATPFASAARISARRKPKLRCRVTGLPASQRANSARAIAITSASMCPASASSARLSVNRPPTNSTIV